MPESVSGDSALRIEYEQIPTLPPLAWCARACAGARGDVAITVLHGADVETRPEGFVEGAWDGDFDAFDFDRAATLSGTGGRLRDGTLVFATPFHPLERLFTLRRPDALFVSNSLVFLLAQAGDGLDLSYPGYFFDLVAQVRNGINAGPERLRTASGAGVELHRCCNLIVQPDLTLRATPKAPVAPPTCYADYFALLLETTQALAHNAAAAGRKRQYRMVAACSRGYDSTASAALASMAGCREGVTFKKSAGLVGFSHDGPIVDQFDDSGADSLRALGMSATEYDRRAFPALPGTPRAEFYTSPASSTDAGTRVMEDSIRGAVLVSGRHGERYWGPTSRCKRRNFREVDDCHLSGHALTEFRLRAAVVHLPAPYIGAAHGPSLYRITRSPEMRPWLLGTGYYDRPIARRIAEEAGVPRENFGHKKFGAGMLYRDENEESARDFDAFLRSAIPSHILQRMDPRPLSERKARHRGLKHVRTHYSHLPLASFALDVFRTDRRHMLWNSIYLYQFHWGVEKLRSRYSCASVPRRDP